MLAATVYMSWRGIRSRWKFSLASLFIVTTAAALMLAWWRAERAETPDSIFVGIWVLREPGTPMLRLLRLSPSIYVPVLFGTGCLFMCAILFASAAVRFGVRVLHGRGTAKTPA